MSELTKNKIYKCIKAAEIRLRIVHKESSIQHGKK